MVCIKNSKHELFFDGVMSEVAFYARCVGLCQQWVTIWRYIDRSCPRLCNFDILYVVPPPPPPIRMVYVKSQNIRRLFIGAASNFFLLYTLLGTLLILNHWHHNYISCPRLYNSDIQYVGHISHVQNCQEFEHLLCTYNNTLGSDRHHSEAHPHLSVCTQSKVGAQLRF